jgi:hypothetical protein
VSDADVPEAVTPAEQQRIDLRETYRAQLVASIGGWTGMVITALPTVVFVAVNATAGLRPAIVAAIGTGVVLAGYRLARRQPTQQALSGLFAVLIAALIAARTGQARGYFLLGIWASFAYAVPFIVSIAVRRPLIGWLWEFLDPADPHPVPGAPPWHKRRLLLRGYTWATLIGTVLFLARGSVQAALYHKNLTGWLSVAKIAMGTPLYIIAVAAAFWVGRQARHAEQARLAAERGPLVPDAGTAGRRSADGRSTDGRSTADPAGHRSECSAEHSADRSADDRAPDRGLGLG